MRIGELSAGTGASVRSLRYYEEQGLLASTRTPSGQRRYDERAVERVRMIRRLYAAGLSSRTILDLLNSGRRPDVPAPGTLDRLAATRQRIDTQLADLSATRERLDALIDVASTGRCPRVEEWPA